MLPLGPMEDPYSGPLRHEPLAVELHNTRYAVRGDIVDGLETAEGLRAWLAAIADRLPAPAMNADPARQPEFVALRTAVGEILEAVLEKRRPAAAALEVVNAAVTRAPVSPLAVVDAGGGLQAGMSYHDADPTDIALAAIAADAVGLATGPARDELRACGAPGCVLMFRKDHPRRAWCSPACGNRARQARHYERVRNARR
jgi:predicted RNA-binding Zn ribbon-like protein